MTPYTKRAVYAACSLALGVPSVPASAQSNAAPPRTLGVDDSTVQRLIRERVDSRLNAGIVVGIIDASGRRVFAFGKHGGPESAPVDANTVFEIGSITKTFTTALLADLAKRGAVALDDPVARYLPATVRLRQNGRAITLLDLATQSSGLPAIPANMRPRDRDDPYVDYAAPQLYEYLSSFTPPRPPGAKYEYSNVGFGLLGHALSQRAGTSYEALVTERILRPLRMTNTRITMSPDVQRRLAIGHNRDGDTVSTWNFDALAGAGALRSTLNDMLIYLAANLDSASSPLGEALQMTHASRAETTSPNLTIGLAWHLLRANGSTIVWHNGETGGYHAFIGFDPARRTGVVILSNSATSIDDLGFHLIDRRNALQQITPSPTGIAQDSTLLERYVGDYELAPNVDLAITRSADKLYVRLTGQQRFRLYATSDSTYRVGAVDAQLSFHSDGAGRVTEVVLHQGGRDMRAPRRGGR